MGIEFDADDLREAEEAMYGKRMTSKDCAEMEAAARQDPRVDDWGYADTAFIDDEPKAMVFRIAEGYRDLCGSEVFYASNLKQFLENIAEVVEDEEEEVTP